MFLTRQGKSVHVVDEIDETQDSDSHIFNKGNTS